MLPSTQAMRDFKRSPGQFLYVSEENWSIDLVPDLVLRRQREGCGFLCINLLKIKWPWMHGKYNFILLISCMDENL